MLNLVNILVLYIIVCIAVALVEWIIVPLFRKRAYFYYYQNDGFYIERHPLGLFRRIRNIRWTIKDKTVGYVEKNRGDIDGAFDQVIYLKAYGRNPVGGAIFEDGVCKIYLIYHENDGGLTPQNYRPVGYIDNGKIYKYYADREAWLNNIPLDKPGFIGDCECPGSDWFGKKKWKTNGEKPDEDVLYHIEEDRGIATNRDGLKDSWPYFRRNRYRRRFVRTKQMNSGISVPDGKTFYAVLCSKLWRFLHVYPVDWDCKAMAWGYGYCTEDWRNPFNKNDDNGTPMICRAAAALLLARYEGFVLDPDEIPQREKKGPIPTVLISLCLYLCLYFFFQSIAQYLVFPIMGTMLNETTILVGLFFVLWLFIIHPIRCLLMERTDMFESFLEKLNTNTGVASWMVWLIVISVCGIIASIFWVGYQFFPIYVCALTTFVLNWAVYNARRWPIEGYGDSGMSQYDNERTEGRKRRSHNNEKTDGLEKDEDQPEGEEKTHTVTFSTPTKNISFKESLFFNKDRLLELRKTNPSRRPNGMFEGGYPKTAAEMVESEVNSDGSVYSKVNRLATLVNDYAIKNHLSPTEKIQLIMSLCQPDNVLYQFDHECSELMIDGFNTGILNEDNSAYKEYCRYPTETLYDKRGDCDCHAALAGALFAACGFGCCYIVGDTNLGAHAALGLEITSGIDILRQYKQAVFTNNGKDYLYVETAGRCTIGRVPDGFEEMLNGDCYPINPNHLNNE